MSSKRLRILIIKPSSLGDIVHALAVVQSLKDQLPNSEIFWVVREVFAPIVSASKAVSHVFVFKRHGGAAGFGVLLGEMRAVRFDWVFDMQGLARSGLLTLAARAPRKHKVGRSDSREGAKIAYGRTIALPEAGKKAHAIEILLPFLSVLGLKPELCKPIQFRELPELAFLETIGGRDLLVLFPSSRRPEKEWQGFYGLTSQLLANNKDYLVIWAGSDELVSDSQWPSNRFLNLCAKTTVPELIQLIGMARLVVCNDSGPMHIAAAVGTELVAIFGPTLAQQYGPYPLELDGHHVIAADDGDLENISVRAVNDVVRACLK